MPGSAGRVSPACDRRDSPEDDDDDDLCTNEIESSIRVAGKRLTDAQTSDAENGRTRKLQAAAPRSTRTHRSA